jgi:hypothetical protein
MLSAIAVNFNYINSVADRMTDIARSLDFSDPEECGKQIDALEKLWKKNEAIFSLSVNFKETDHLGETLLALKAAHKSSSKDEFEKSRELLIDAIDGVSRLERFSVLNIF